MTYLDQKQIDQLLKPVNPSRVRQREGNSYMEAHDIKAHLSRVFGFGNYDSEVFDLDLLYERPGKNKNGGDAISVGYRAGVRLTVHTPHRDVLATYTEYAAASATNYPVNKMADAHDMAMKAAASYALKRCAIHLGDQFGLSLYNNGSVAPFVGGTLVGVQDGSAPDDVPVSDETEPTATPVKDEAPAPSPGGASPAQVAAVFNTFSDAEKADKPGILRALSDFTKRPIMSSRDLTPEEADAWLAQFPEAAA